MPRPKEGGATVPPVGVTSGVVLDRLETLHPESQGSSTVPVGVPEDSSVVVLGRSRRQLGRGRR